MKTKEQIKETIENLYKIANGPKPWYVKDFRNKKQIQAEILEWVLKD